MALVKFPGGQITQLGKIDSNVTTQKNAMVKPEPKLAKKQTKSQDISSQLNAVMGKDAQKQEYKPSGSNDLQD